MRAFHGVEGAPIIQRRHSSQSGTAVLTILGGLCSSIACIIGLIMLSLAFHTSASLKRGRDHIENNMMETKCYSTKLVYSRAHPCIVEVCNGVVQHTIVDGSASLFGSADIVLDVDDTGKEISVSGSVAVEAPVQQQLAGGQRNVATDDDLVERSHAERTRTLASEARSLGTRAPQTRKRGMPDPLQPQPYSSKECQNVKRDCFELDLEFEYSRENENDYIVCNKKIQDAIPGPDGQWERVGDTQPCWYPTPVSIDNQCDIVFKDDWPNDPSVYQAKITAGAILLACGAFFVIVIWLRFKVWRRECQEQLLRQRVAFASQSSAGSSSTTGQQEPLRLPPRCLIQYALKGEIRSLTMTLCVDDADSITGHVLSAHGDEHGTGKYKVKGTCSADRSFVAWVVRHIRPMRLGIATHMQFHGVAQPDATGTSVVVHGSFARNDGKTGTFLMHSADMNTVPTMGGKTNVCTGNGVEANGKGGRSKGNGNSVANGGSGRDGGDGHSMRRADHAWSSSVIQAGVGGGGGGGASATAGTPNSATVNPFDDHITDDDVELFGNHNGMVRLGAHLRSPTRGAGVNGFERDLSIGQKQFYDLASASSPGRVGSSHNKMFS